MSLPLDSIMRDNPALAKPPLQGKARFSSRTAWDTAESPLARALRERLGAGLPLIDLTASNPTRCGFNYDESLLAALSDPRALDYDANPRGLPAAREAVRAYYADHSAEVPIGRIFLTTSTSEAYSYLFRLLCDPGDEVLIARPSYPLFDFLAALDDVRLVPYELVYDDGWQLDLPGLRQQITPRSRAIALVHPNNPTGHFIKAWERQALEELCAEYGLALIVDEVFLDYPLEPAPPPYSFACPPHPVPTFVLSGLSKIAGLPQMKAAWIACFGPSAPLRDAENRLEVIADTFLSMNAPIQHALPAWLGERRGLQEQILARTTANLAQLDRQLARQRPVSRLRTEAGWYATLRIPALRPDEETALALIDAGVSVHPGYFFGFRDSGWLVVSLLPPLADFEAGVATIFKHLGNESS